MPLERSSRGVYYPQESGAWPRMPVNYPPGMFAVFLPTALLGRYVPMTQETFGRVGVVWMLVLAHLALLAIFLLLAEVPPGGRAVVGMIAWVYLVPPRAAGLLRPGLPRRGRHVPACAAPAAPRRGAALAGLRRPAALPRGGARAGGRRGALAGPSRAPGRTSLGCRSRWSWGPASWWWGAFLLQWPVTKTYLDTLHPSLGAIGHGARFWAVVVASVAAAAAAWWYGGPLVAGLVLAALGLALTDIYDWWHGAVLLFAPLAVGVLGARAASTARAVLVGWLLLMQPLGFDETPSHLFLDFAKHYRTRS